MMLPHRAASIIVSLRNRAHDHLIDRRLNIHTAGTKRIDVADAVPYSTFAYHTIDRVLDRLDLDTSDALADIGCGKGRVVCLAALRPLRNVIGIDVDAHLCALARENAARLRRRRAPIDIVHVPAQQFDYVECTALMLFNPFNFGTLAATLDAWRDSLRRRPRSLRLAYVNPRCESVLREAADFEEFDRWPLRRGERNKFEVSFWRNVVSPS